MSRASSTPRLRLRARQLGASYGYFPTGETNTLVDVPGVRVGHTTLIEDDAVFTGATAILLDGVSPKTPASAGIFVGNGFGKFVGATQVMELGQLETPLVLTSTLSAFRAADALVTWELDRKGAAPSSINPVVGEINDSWISDYRRRPMRTEHFLEALAVADRSPVAMGNVGGGTGACALGFKGGIGSASRQITVGGKDYTLGVLVQANMDGELRAFGRSIPPSSIGLPVSGPVDARGSCVVIVATDAPLDASALRRVATRGVFGLARVGARFSHGSGDYGLAVSTNRGEPRVNLSSADATATFEATMDGVEEAVIDALLAAETISSANGRVAHALPIEAVGN